MKKYFLYFKYNFHNNYPKAIINIESIMISLNALTLQNTLLAALDNLFLFLFLQLKILSKHDDAYL